MAGAEVCCTNVENYKENAKESLPSKVIEECACGLGVRETKENVKAGEGCRGGRRGRRRKPFQDLEFCDAFMFAAILENAELCREMLERILGFAIERVVFTMWRCRP